MLFFFLGLAVLASADVVREPIHKIGVVRKPDVLREPKKIVKVLEPLIIHRENLRHCLSLEELASLPLVQKLAPRRYLHLLLSELKANCVNFNLVNRKNRELAQIFGGPDPEPLLVNHLNALLAAYTKDNTNYIQTQVAAIAEGLRLIQESDVQDVDNHALEQVYYLSIGLVNFAKRGNPAIGGLFEAQQKALHKVVQIRSYIRREPFEGIRLTNGTVALLRVLINGIKGRRDAKDPISRSKLVAGIFKAVRLARLDDEANIREIGKQTIRITEDLAEALNHVKSNYYRRNIIYNYYKINQLSSRTIADYAKVPVHAQTLVNRLRSAKVEERLVAPLQRQAELLAYIVKSFPHHPPFVPPHSSEGSRGGISVVVPKEPLRRTAPRKIVLKKIEEVQNDEVERQERPQQQQEDVIPL